MASSACNQNAPRSLGSGKVSAAKGVIWANMAFLSRAGRWVASDLRSQTPGLGWLCWC